MKSKRRRINKITFAVVAVFMLLAAGCGSSAKISETTSQPANDLFPDKPHKKVNNLYVLGDSLSDTGNLFTIIDGLLLNHNIRMQSPPASVGGQKFSNNYLVAEYVAAHYEVSLGNGWKLANLKKDIMKAVEKEAIHKLVPWLTAFNNNGVCNCSNICNGKGKGNGDGDCKKITIAIFNSGKIIITGGRSEPQIVESYNYIYNLLKNKEKYIV